MVNRVADDKLEALGRLAVAVAHDLGSPMTSILVFSEALMRKAEGSSLAHEHAAEIHQAARRCRDLIQALLKFARRPREASISRVPLAPLLQGARLLLQHVADMARVKLALELPAEDAGLTVLARSADLEQVLVQLLLATISAASPTQVIVVVVERRQADLVLRVALSAADGGAPLAQSVEPPPHLGLWRDLLEEMGGALEEDGAGWRVRLRVDAPQETR